MKKTVPLALDGAVSLAACHLGIGLVARAASRDATVVPIEGTVDVIGRIRSRAPSTMLNASRAVGPVLD